MVVCVFCLDEALYASSLEGLHIFIAYLCVHVCMLEGKVCGSFVCMHECVCVGYV